MRGDLAAAPAADGVLDLLGQHGQLVLGDGAALAGPPDAAHDLVPVERLGDAAALADREDHALLRGEPATAGRARPAAADGGAVLGRSAVYDAAVGMAAIRAVDAITSLAAAEDSPQEAQPGGKLQR